MPIKYDHLLKVLLVGDSEAAKSLVLTLTDGSYKEFVVKTLEFDDEKETLCKLQLWTKLPNMGAYQQKVIQDLDAVIFICDKSNKESLGDISKEQAFQQRMLDVYNPRGPKLFFLMAIKSNTAKPDEISDQELKARTQQLNLPEPIFVDIASDESVTEAFILVSKIILSPYEYTATLRSNQQDDAEQEKDTSYGESRASIKMFDFLQHKKTAGSERLVDQSSTASTQNYGHKK